jgi:hypothetical protein
MSHAEFLQLLLADEVSRRDTTSAARKAKAAGLDERMRLEHWDATANVTYNQASSTNSPASGSSTPARTR